MAKLLIIYSSTDGQTRRICERLREVIASADHDVELIAIDERPDLPLADYDRIVIGARIRYGKHAPEVLRFIRDNAKLLNAGAHAFFSVNVVARKPEKNRPETNPYVVKLLKQIPWRPREVEVFAGRIEYARYGFFDRQMIRFIMWITKGPTALDTVAEFTNWGRVEAFGRRLARF